MKLTDNTHLALIQVRLSKEVKTFAVIAILFFKLLLLKVTEHLSQQTFHIKDSLVSNVNKIKTLGINLIQMQELIFVVNNRNSFPTRSLYSVVIPESSWCPWDLFHIVDKLHIGYLADRNTYEVVSFLVSSFNKDAEKIWYLILKNSSF